MASYLPATGMDTYQWSTVPIEKAQLRREAKYRRRRFRRETMKAETGMENEIY
jgi:hypothetical protein